MQSPCAVMDLTLKWPELSPWVPAVTFTDERPYFVSESYIAGDLAKWLEERGTGHFRGAPNHPQRQ